MTLCAYLQMRACVRYAKDYMKTFSSICKDLKKQNVAFETIEFTDVAVSARTTDTSLAHNYNPQNAIKTLIVRTTKGLRAVILKGPDTVDEQKLEAIIGKWSIVPTRTLSTLGFTPGTVCPLDVDLPIIIDSRATTMTVWSVGAGDIKRGLNVSTTECLRVLSHAQIVHIAVPNELQSHSWYSKKGTMDPITHLLTRGVDTIYPSREALEKVLRSGKKLRLYQGFDPTGTQLHIGHAVAMRKLRQWQDLGHHVIFLIGDGTGQAGDPSGKMKARGRFMTKEELRQNARDYVKQAAKIVRFDGENPVEILYNSDWLNKLNLVDMLGIAQHFSVQQLIERDMFQERMKKGESINLREFLYPLLQGYDSVAMNVDLEMGGTDQAFNMLAGRQLVQSMQGREKFVMTVPLLTDAKGVKIGKTEGNVIGLTDAPNDFFGKIMALGDDAVVPCFTLLTDITEEEIERMKRELRPIDFKKKLAFELTKQFNSEKEADAAQKEFETRFQKGNVNDADLPSIRVSSHLIVDVLMEARIASSKSEAKRLVEQKAVKINGSVVSDVKAELHLKSGDILEVGRKAVRIDK